MLTTTEPHKAHAQEGGAGHSQKELKRRGLLLTLPVFNERDRLEGSVRKLLAMLSGINADYGIALVEDGSNDGSAAVAQALSEKYPFVYFIHSDRRLGRGEAIRRCWQHMYADVYVFMDTDLSADLAALPVLMEKVREGSDIVTGSRYCEGATVSRPPIRKLVSIVYNWLVRTMFHDDIQDHQCGFKAFSRRAVRDLLPLTKEPTWFWDTEILVLAHKLGYNVTEIPVTWNEMKTKRTPLRRLFSDFFVHGTGLLRLRTRVNSLDTQRVLGSSGPGIRPSSSPMSVTPNGGEQVSVTNRVLMLVNNYASTGIGDFGLDLRSNLARRGVHPILLSTPTSWIDFPRYFFSTLMFSGRVIFNIGLTSWGRSHLRNFIGFLSIRLRHTLGRSDIILLHNVIETIDLDTAGYNVSPIAQGGAHLAIMQLREIPIVVFSQRMEKLLLLHYGIAPVFWHPLPVDSQPPRTRPQNGLPTLLMIGYLSPYKGYEFLLNALKIADFPHRMLIVGDEHRVLSHDPTYQEFLTSLRVRAQAQRITCMPKIPAQDLPKLMAEVDLGVLPYDACEGACAAASLLISHHVPILASDLPEFRELADQGSGIVLSPRDPNEFARRMKETVGNPNLIEALRNKQKQYGEKFSWDNFVGRLQDRLH